MTLGWKHLVVNQLKAHPFQIYGFQMSICHPYNMGSDRCLSDGHAVLELYSFERIRVLPQILCQLALQTGMHILAFNLLLRGSARYEPPVARRAPVPAPAREEERVDGAGDNRT